MNNRWLPWWIVGYAAMTVIVVWTLFAARRTALRDLATPKSVAEWQAWRTDVQEQQTRPGPVQRRVPKSNEPPALVLMRDHFAVCLGGAILFSTALYWVVAWLVTGMLAADTSSA